MTLGLVAPSLIILVKALTSLFFGFGVPLTVWPSKHHKRDRILICKILPIYAVIQMQPHEILMHLQLD